MTNTTETAAACNIKEEVLCQFTQGEEIVNTVSVWLAEKGISFALNVVVAALILLFGWLAIKVIVGAVKKAILRGGKSKSLLVDFAGNAVSKICWAVLIVVVLGRLGINVGPIVAGLGVTGFILGFAFQETLGNLASGLMIAINEPFKVGDYVAVAGHEGGVLKVDMMATVLASADNRKIVIPNKSAWGSPIVNYSSLGVRRVDVKIGIDYGCDVSKAVEIALATIKGIPGVLTDPAPVVAVGSLDDSQVTLNIRPWSKVADYWSVYDAVQQLVKKAFEENNVAIPFPQLTVHLDK